MAASLSGHIIIWNVAEAFEPCKVLDASTSLAGKLLYCASFLYSWLLIMFNIVHRITVASQKGSNCSFNFKWDYVVVEIFTRWPN